MKKILLLFCSLLGFLFITISCTNEDDLDDLNVLELGSSSIEVTQDGFTFRFWLAGADGIEKNVFAKGELINFCYSVKNDKEVGQWVGITPPCCEGWGVVYQNGKLIAAPYFAYEDILIKKYFEPSSTIDRKTNWQQSNSPMPVLKRGKYHTSIQASFPLYDEVASKPDSEINPSKDASSSSDKLNFPELQLNFGIQ